MQPVYIISPEKVGMSNQQRKLVHESMRLELETLHLPYKQVIGCYEGVNELSYVVIGTEWDMSKIEKLREHYNQDCFLYSDTRRHTTLHFGDGSVQSLGKLHGVSKEVAQTRANYTTDGENYWITNN